MLLYISEMKIKLLNRTFNKSSAYLLPAVAIILLFFFFYKFGFLKYYTLRNQKLELIQKIAQVEAENKLLRSEIDSLKYMDSKIEKVAREKFKMMRKGEKIFSVEEQ